MTVALTILKWLFGSILEFVMKPSNWAIAGIIVFFAFSAGYWKGDRHRDRIWTARIEAEREKQAQIVARSDNEALGKITKLNETVEQQNALITELMAEADTDSNAARPALGAPSLQRLNRIGPRKAR